MNFPFPRSIGVIASSILTVLSLSAAHAQDPSIDRLLKKLPPPEKLVKPTVERAVRQSDPALRDPLASQVFSAAQSNNGGRALDLCRKLSAKYPKSAGSECLHGIVALTFNLNRIQQAIPPLQRAARLAPRDFLVQAQLGFCLQATGQLDAGIEHLRKGADLAPKTYGAVWEHLGLAYQKKGMHREAVKAFERAVQIMPNYGPAWRHLADEYRALGRTAEASQAEARARSSPAGKTGPKSKR